VASRRTNAGNFNREKGTKKAKFSQLLAGVASPQKKSTERGNVDGAETESFVDGA